MGLERIRLSNFQRHERLDVKFDPQVTTITGASDTGKSSIIRALRWLAFNRPLGTGFVRDGAERASVRLEVDGCKVDRRKGKGGNTYAVDGKRLAAVGSDVPESVAELLNLGEENVAMQHDPPYFFGLTPGEVARRLNRIVDLGAIDDATAEIGRRLRKARVEAEVVGDRLVAADADRDRLEFVPELDAVLGLLEQKGHEVDSKGARAVSAAELVAGGVELGRRVRRLRGVAEGGSVVLEGAEKSRRSSEQAAALSGLVDRASAAWRDASREVPGLCGLDALLDRLKVRRARYGDCWSIVETGRGMESKMNGFDVRLRESRSQLEEETGGVCPLCGGPMK